MVEKVISTRNSSNENTENILRDDSLVMVPELVPAAETSVENKASDPKASPGQGRIFCG